MCRVVQTNSDGRWNNRKTLDTFDDDDDGSDDYDHRRLQRNGHAFSTMCVCVFRSMRKPRGRYYVICKRKHYCTRAREQHSSSS